MDASTWANFISGGSFVVAVLALMLAWNSQRKAEAAGNAADRSAHAQERMARALELQAIARAKASAEPEVAWQLVHHGGDRYLLENVGTATAFDVMVTAPEGLWFRPPENDVEDLAPRASTTFTAARSLGTHDDTITVAWSDHSGGEHRRTWHRPLPPKG